METYKVAIIGGGPGGYETAIRLNQYGIDCVVLEKERLGGICLNWGCIPTKALVKSAEIWQDCKEATQYGLVDLPPISIMPSYKQIAERKNEVVKKLSSGIEYIFSKRKIPVLKSCVQQIQTTEKGYLIISDKYEDILAEYIIIATGSIPKELPNVKIDEKDILSSTGILQLETLPKSLAIIGGGVIGCEFATIFAIFGVDVTIIEFLPSIIATEDEEIAKRLHISLKKAGIKIKNNCSVHSYEKIKDEITLYLSDDTQLIVEKVLLSVGRTACDNIHWSPKAPEREKGAVKIDSFMQTSLEKVFAIGDVTGKLQLAHTASKQGLICAEHIKNMINQTNNELHHLNYENIPRCIFTNPEVGSVGLTEQQARDKYQDIVIGRFPFSANGKALAGGNSNGFVKTIARKDNLQLVGMHIIGPNATELIAQGSILINLKITAHDLEQVIFAHPTLSEAIMESVEDLKALSIHKI